MRTSEQYVERLHYVRQNPVRAGLVEKPEDWPFQGKLHDLIWRELHERAKPFFKIGGARLQPSPLQDCRRLSAGRRGACSSPNQMQTGLAKVASKSKRCVAMPICFMIQPFDDGGKFDKRFEDVFAPAIKDAGLEPYRVDKDPGVQVPIEAIEQNIRTASICLCDITTDSPNVWYELGYAFATGRSVVMVCSDERVPRHKYPFDIQHRTIIPYQADSPRDFVKLRENITRRLKAQLSGSNALEAIRADEQIAPVQGLSQPELAVIVSIAGNAPMPNDNVSAYTVRNEVEKAGFTSIAFGLGMKRLCAKDFVQVVETEDYDNRTCQVVSLTSTGWGWIEANEDKFILKREAQAAVIRAQRIRTTQKTTEDEIDF